MAPADGAGPPPLAACTSPLTTASTMSPRTSSMTAAPRIVSASGRRMTPRSFSTRAVMPTLVAVRVAPTNTPTSMCALRKEPGGDPPAEGERHGQSDQGDQRRRRARPGEGPQIGLEPDVEEQDEDAHLGEDVERGLTLDEADALVAEQGRQEVAEADPHDQLAEHRRLAPPLGQEAAGLGRDHEHGEPEQDRAGGAGLGRRGPRRRRGEPHDEADSQGRA